MATRATLAYSPPGAGKTEALIAVIKMVFETTGKTARVYVGDGSRANYEDSGLIEAGILELFDYRNQSWPMSVTNRMAEGWWPDASGVLKPTPPEKLAQIGVFGYEALSTMIREYLMGNIKGGLAEQSARGIKIGQDSPFTIRDAEVQSVNAKGEAVYQANTGTGEVFGGNPISHFNVAQTHALGVIDRSLALPGWVWWNTHEKLGEEKRTEKSGNDVKTTTTGDTAIGPEVAGGALSMSIPRKFNDTLHFTIARKTETATDSTTNRSAKAIKDEYRLYFRDHYDPDGVVTQVPYRAVVRCAKPELLPKEGYYTGAKGEAVIKLYKTLAEAKRLATAEAQALVEKRKAAEKAA